jgi:hypothetical protein
VSAPKTIKDNFRITINAASEDDANGLVVQILRHTEVKRSELQIAFDNVCPWCRNVHGFEPDENGAPQCCRAALQAWEESS